MVGQNRTAHMHHKQPRALSRTSHTHIRFYSYHPLCYSLHWKENVQICNDLHESIDPFGRRRRAAASSHLPWSTFVCVCVFVLLLLCHEG